MRTALITASFGLAAISSAFTGVVPNGYETIEAPGTFAISSSTTGGRTYQLLVNANQLTSFVNTNLTGIQFRLNGSATANFAGTTYTDFDIYLGESVAIGSRSSTFANNWAGSATQVRDGGLTLAANSLTAGSSPNAFGTMIAFDTPYAYTGGNLILEMRYSSSTVNPTLDAVLSSGVGYGSDFAAAWGSGYSGTTATTISANALVTQFSAEAVPEPATLAVLGLAGVALLGKRRSIR